jgi:hypothetical protein
MLAPQYEKEIRALVKSERVNAVIWKWFAVLQIISVIYLVFGIYNLSVARLGAARADDIENLDSGIPAREERRLGWMVGYMIFNLLVGGMPGFWLCMQHLIDRNRILKIREAFENPQACIERQTVGAW